MSHKDENLQVWQEWLDRDRDDPRYKIIRAGLAKILPFDLAELIDKTRVKITGYDRDGTPATFELRGINESAEIVIDETDTDLDWLALHLFSSWLRFTSG